MSLPWIKTAESYIGIEEIEGAIHNDTIIGWLKTLGAWKSLLNDEDTWCATFASFCLGQNGLCIPVNWFRALAFDASDAKQKYKVGFSGKSTSVSGIPENVRPIKLKGPAYGCVAVKKRTGGHVAFIVGKSSSDGLLCLGGNQNNKVQILEYGKDDYHAFYWYGGKDTWKESFYDLPVGTASGKAGGEA